MKFGHLLFPTLFFLILISGAVWIMRTVEEVSSVNANQTVYLETSGRSVEVTAESVGSTREKAHQAFMRFADPLVANDVLSLEEQENLFQILQLGEAHWEEENWAPAFYAFDRILNDLSPLIDEGLGQQKAEEIEQRYSEMSQFLTNEIILVESTYLEAIETANDGYNALLAKDWLGAIQAFAKALDTLNLVKAQSAEVVNDNLQEAYRLFEAGDFDTSSQLFNLVLAVNPELEEAKTGLQLIEDELAVDSLVLEAELLGTEEVPSSLTIPGDEIAKWEESDHATVIEADRYFSKRELKDSLRLYLEVRAKEPELPGLDERIARNRKALLHEELIRLMDKATILAELEQWTAVIKTYRHILNVDPVNIEARRGWEEALVSLVDQKQVEQFKRLARHHINARQFSHAKEVLAEARNVLYDFEDFDQSFLTLFAELDAQLRPVELLIESDGDTWVCIPGRLEPEQFTQKIITVFPGKLELFGWKKGHAHTKLSLAFRTSEIPETVSVICDTPITYKRYSKLPKDDRVVAALNAYNMKELLSDVDGFIARFRKGNKADYVLRSAKQLAKWDSSLFTQMYFTLSQQAVKSFELTRLEARGQFVQVPEILTRKETIELGQYLASLK